MLTKSDLQKIWEVIKDEIQLTLKSIKTKLNRIAKHVNYMIKSFDERITANERAIQKLQKN